ncbi:hypothetical protein [uncultured Sphaerochaeta sp.]|uniref:hypothetical protein n=1 Tax=uncultured Sphaerochaeta sp. TaxID=886478 RepID=UPI0029CA38A9|nr:hypothetical protein [uncultured Sphaerochaeta sp.]
MAYYRQAYAQKSRYNRSSSLRKIAEKHIRSYPVGTESGFYIGGTMVKIFPRSSLVQFREPYKTTVKIFMKEKQGNYGRYFYGKAGKYVVYINPYVKGEYTIKVYEQERSNAKYRRIPSW